MRNSPFPRSIEPDQSFRGPIALPNTKKKNSVNPHILTKNLVRNLIITIVVCTFVGTVHAKPNEKQSWQKIEETFGNEFYPQSMKDSLYEVFKVDPAAERNLRVFRDTGSPYTFQRFERCVYEGGWQFINAGYGILTTQYDSATGIVSSVGKVFTNGVMSAFYEVRDYSRSLIDGRGLYPLFFEHHIFENRRYRNNTWVLNNNARGTIFTNGRKEGTTFKVAPFTHDYVSLFLHLRSLTFAPGDTFSIRCFAHGKDHPIRFTVHGREQVVVKAGTFNCLKVQPRLVGEGKYGFTRDDTMYLWLTDDAHHIPIMVVAKVKLGSINIKLIHYERN